MSPYRYIKRVNRGKKSGRSKMEVWVTGISFLAVFLGLVMLGVSVGSVAFYEVFTSWRFREADLLAPVGLETTNVLGIKSLGVDSDLSRIDQWYPTISSRRNVPARVGSYILTVPKLGIDRGLVKIGGEDLSQSLIHFGSTALPGERGNGVIIGHSTLPQFFDQKNYLTIFSLLPRLEIGDQFLIYYDGIEYRYQVEDMTEVKPDDLSVLEQRTDDSYITLITCVPPGLKTRRLAVRGRIVRAQGL